MRTPLLLLAAAACAPALSAQTSLLTESFESNDDGYTLSNSFNDGTSDHFQRTDGNDISNVTGPYSNIDGSFFFAMEDTDDDGGDGLDEKSITFDPIDATGFTGLMLSVRAGAGNESPAGASSYDAADFALFRYAFDGGAFQDCLAFRYAGTDGFNEPLAQDTNFDGIGDGTVLGTALQTFSCAISTAGVSDPSTLVIQGDFSFDSASEEFGFDLLEVTGTAASQTATLTVLPASATAMEGDTTFIPVTLSTSDGQPLASDVEFTVTQTGGTADNDDYAPFSAFGQTFDGDLPETLFIPAGTNSGQTIALPIPLEDDSIAEGTETAIVTLTSPDATFTNDTFTLTITDNDASPDVSGSIGYGTCPEPPAQLAAGYERCFVELQGTNNLDNGQRYTVFLVLEGPDGFSHVAYRGEVKPRGGQSITRSAAFTTVRSDPSGPLTLRFLVEQGSVPSPPSTNAVELGSISLIKATPLARVESALE